MEHLLKTMMFWVSVPVLSEKMNSTWPSSSFRVVVRAWAAVPIGLWYIFRSQLMKWLWPSRRTSTLMKFYWAIQLFTNFLVSVTGLIWKWLLRRLHRCLPDIQRDGHNSVEDDDVGPEGEESREHSTNLERVPRQKHSEVCADIRFPNSVSNCQNNSHTNKEGENLKKRQEYIFLFPKMHQIKWYVLYAYMSISVVKGTKCDI